jgi:hypothetical protein
MEIVLGIIIGAVVTFFGLWAYSASKKKKNQESKEPGTLNSSSQPVTSPLVKLNNLIQDAVKELTTVEKVSYEEAMKFFIDHKNDSTTIKKGAMLREGTDGGYVFLTQVFLDKDNNVVCNVNGMPIGRKLKVIRFDEELLNVFKKEDLVIVE